uniref:glycine--tRNA ligase n=1 Tax=Thermosphaera aggregans TaxID=54254 RepID=A0A7C2FEQ0_9CREN
MNTSEDIYDTVMDLARRRGFFWGSFEIYGGVAGFYDYGPLGVLLKRRIQDLWLKHFVYSNDMVVEVETPIINPRVVFKASGHEESFTDPVTECLKCGRIYRVDHLLKEVLGVEAEGLSPEEYKRIIVEKNVKCPVCSGDLAEPSYTLLLFKTEIGPYKGSLGYLRPENAQGMFVNFANVLRITRNKLPLGIAQVGKVARNEISPRQGLLRLREFTIMEIEFFFDPETVAEDISEYLSEEIVSEKLNVLTAEDREKGVSEPRTYTVGELIEKGIVKTPWLALWMGIGNRFLRHLGIDPARTRFIEKLPKERAHYSAQTFDQEVKTEKYGWIEVAGYAYRTTYDLERHIMFSNADLTFFKRFEKPLEKKVGKAFPNISKIREVFGNRYSEIMRKLSEKQPSELYSELEKTGFIEVDGSMLGKEFFTFKEEVEKIHGAKIIPHVVEPSFGLERLLYVVLENSLKTREEKAVLTVPPQIAPYQVAVFPLVTGSKPEHKKIVEMARNIYWDLVKAGFNCIYDDDGSIGRRYARVDEIGVPFAITVDYQSIEDNTVTVRDRDTTLQERVHLDELKRYLAVKLGITVF